MGLLGPSSALPALPPGIGRARHDPQARSYSITSGSLPVALLASAPTGQRSRGARAPRRYRRGQPSSRPADTAGAWSAAASAEQTLSSAAEGGASAQRDHERRPAKREAGIRGRYPRLGGLILALTGAAQIAGVGEQAGLHRVLLVEAAEGQQVPGQGLAALDRLHLVGVQLAPGVLQDAEHGEDLRD